MSNVGYATLTVIPSAKGFGSALAGDINPQMGKSGKVAGAALGGGILSGFKPLIGGLVVGAAGAATIGFLKDAVGAASDLSETAGKAGQIFGQDALPALEKFAAGAARSMGQSKTEALNAAATFGVFGKSAGLTGTALTGFSTQMVGLSSDLASFGNTTPQEAIEAVGAAMRGEAEPIRKYGILLDDATLRNRALKLGLIKTTKEALTPQNKVLASQAEILAQTKDAQGDFARTSGGLANQQRILSASWENAKTTIGNALLPAMTSIVSLINKYLAPAVEKIPGLFTQIGAVVGPIFDQIKYGFDIVTSAFSGFETDTGGMGWADNLQNGANGIITVFDTLKTAFGPVISGIITQVVPAFQQIVAAVQKWIAVALPIAQAFITGLWVRLQPLLPRIAAIFATIGTIVATAMQVIAQVISLVTSVISYVWTNFGQGILNFIGTIWSAIIGVIEPAINLVLAIIRTVLAVLHGDWSGAWQGIKDIVSSAWSLIASIVTGALSIVGGAIRLALSVIGTLFSAVWSGITGVVSSAWSGITSAISTGVTTAVNFIKELPGKALSALSGLGSTLLSAGSDLVGGFIRGIQSRAGDIIATVKNAITDKLPDFVKNALGIHSPSRVFMAIGAHTAEGMALGISRGAAGVQRAANGLVPAAPGFGSPDVGSGLNGSAGANAGGPLVGSLTLQSSGNARTDLDEVNFHLRRLSRGGVHA